MITDSLGHASFEAMLATAARLKMDRLEFACGNWSKAPHVQLDRMLDSTPARQEFLASLADHGTFVFLWRLPLVCRRPSCHTWWR